ncbi:MAG TPA: SpoIIE family protein phosphatase [Acidimicrobiia bacterium]|nr:SpoIIE family protein phosphatase [Acidimicrobiia bacterium]
MAEHVVTVPWTRRVRAVLPQGGSLPEDIWRARHTGITVVLWTHAVFIPLFALARGFSLLHALAEGAIVPSTALLAMSPGLGRRARTVVASLGLLSASAVLVHLSGGVIEMHFHFFVMVALVTLYQDWLPFLAAVGYVFVHHGLIGALDSSSVFNHFAARNQPWKWAGIHALFITALSLVCLVTWRLSESLLAERRQAEERLREESRITETLHEVGTALAAELETHKVIQIVTDAATRVTEAAFGAFFYNVVDDRGESYLLYTLSGAPIEAFSGFGLPHNTPIFGPTFAGEAPVRIGDVTADPRYGRTAPHHGLPAGHPAVRSYLAVPVRSRTGEVLGGLFFGHPEADRFDDSDERTVVGIASHAAVAIDNARLYESECASRAAAEAAGTRLALLADATRALTSSLELDVMLRDLARLLTPAVADLCLIDLVEPDGSMRRVASAGPSGHPHWAARLERLRPPGEDSDPALRALRSGRPQLVDADGLSAVVVPLTGRQEALGVLWLATEAAPGTESDPQTATLAEELARRAAMAIENARLFARQRSVSETLQHSLLPERLPEIPGLATAARYVPGGPDVDVGGDWYDVMQLPGGGIGLAMGDVVGRGERAASLMGQLRNAVRAYAFEGKSPHQVIGCVNGLLLDAGSDHMATMIYGVLDAESGELRMVNAGHPPPLLIELDGRARFLEGQNGPPVGALPTVGYTETCTVLAPGATLLLYTDGLVEDRATPLEQGLARLREAVHGGPSDVDGLCSHVARRVLAAYPSNDDVAMLAVQISALGERLDLRVSAEPGVLAPLRATLRRWLAQAGATEAEAYELLTACGEACTNAIRHATGPLRSDFAVHASVIGGHVEIRVRDRGSWRERRGGVGGRGLPIIEAYVDDLEITRSPAGTEVRMRRRLALEAEVVA